MFYGYNETMNTARRDHVYNNFSRENAPALKVKVDIAGKNIASPDSLKRAIVIANTISKI